MSAYKLAGGTGALRASARHFLGVVCPRRDFVTLRTYLFYNRQALANPAESLITGNAGSSLARQQELDADTDVDAVGGGPGPGPGPGSLRDAAATTSMEKVLLPPGLYVIPTPIGNLQDITLRAVDTLRGVNLLLAEDTRRTRKLLNFLGIRHLEVLSCHEHNEKHRLARVLQRLQQGEPVGLVSDAGMPGISDPGHVVVAAAVEAGVRVVVLPGPCAFVTALVGSGLPTEAFTFAGFLPPKSGARRQALERLASQSGTLVLYAPPHGLGSILRDCVEVLGGGRRCCVAREISKMHEEYFRSTLEGALREFSEVREARGEICLLIEGCRPLDLGSAAATAERGGLAGAGAGVAAAAAGPGAVERVLRELLEAGMPVSGAVREVVCNLGANKKAAYATALRLSEQLARESDAATKK
ncbi:hypothetical protein Vretifemale_5207 [Volvox reticuliferus]|uniref:Tetrapyrrole methylase domain-containing protein n=2 Tax=Volvox reticuliferus TaxID=1737510 RepID=A0A8J4C5Y0_9CHLO|nr:hypothetical protein Vretifemale_5207 [Volvox reticuliferus]